MTPTLDALLTHTHLTANDHPAICAAYARLLEMGMNLRPKDDFFPHHHDRQGAGRKPGAGYSVLLRRGIRLYGTGSAARLRRPGRAAGQAITKSPAIAAKEIVLAENGIRATVIGAGNYSLALSGTTIAARRSCFR